MEEPSRFRQLVFISSLLGNSWLAMTAFHELGHVVGAWLTGGEVDRVVIHPLLISRTDVGFNPHPNVVAWAGPVIGSVLPITATLLIRPPNTFGRIVQFIAGFCLIANGAYISFGSFDAVGDCREMYLAGTPQWAMIGFGVVTIPVGFYLWHKLGSLISFLHTPSHVTRQMAWVCGLILVVATTASLLLSPR